VIVLEKLTVEEKLELVRQVGEEIIGEDELKDMMVLSLLGIYI
jgi:hypothetical protein